MFKLGLAVVLVLDLRIRVASVASVPPGVHSRVPVSPAPLLPSKGASSSVRSARQAGSARALAPSPSSASSSPSNRRKAPKELHVNSPGSRNSSKSSRRGTPKSSRSSRSSATLSSLGSPPGSEPDLSEAGGKPVNPLLENNVIVKYPDGKELTSLRLNGANILIALLLPHSEIDINEYCQNKQKLKEKGIDPTLEVKDYATFATWLYMNHKRDRSALETMSQRLNSLLMDIENVINEWSIADVAVLCEMALDQYEESQGEMEDIIRGVVEEHDFLRMNINYLTKLIDELKPLPREPRASHTILFDYDSPEFNALYLHNRDKLKELPIAILAKYLADGFEGERDVFTPVSLLMGMSPGAIKEQLVRRKSEKLSNIVQSKLVDMLLSVGIKVNDDILPFAIPQLMAFRSSNLYDALMENVGAQTTSLYNMGTFARCDPSMRPNDFADAILQGKLKVDVDLLFQFVRDLTGLTLDFRRNEAIVKQILDYVVRGQYHRAEKPSPDTGVPFFTDQVLKAELTVYLLISTCMSEETSKSWSPSSVFNEQALSLLQTRYLSSPENIDPKGVSSVIQYFMELAHSNASDESAQTIDRSLCPDNPLPIAAKLMNPTNLEKILKLDFSFITQQSVPAAIHTDAPASPPATPSSPQSGGRKKSKSTTSNTQAEPQTPKVSEFLRLL